MQTDMKLTCIAHTAFSNEFLDLLETDSNYLDTQGVALTAIRTCYSHLQPSEILNTEADKYFGRASTDDEGGTEADRLFRHITRSGHTSTLEHITFTFAVEGVSRALLAQLTRHRIGFSFSVQSQRYVRFGSGDKSEGFDYVIPDTVKGNKEALGVFINAMEYLQGNYDYLRRMGIPAEDARAILPNSASTNLTMTVNLRAALEFYKKRKKGRGAQAEIAKFASYLRSSIETVAPWTENYFDEV